MHAHLRCMASCQQEGDIKPHEQLQRHVYLIELCCAKKLVAKFSEQCHGTYATVVPQR